MFSTGMETTLHTASKKGKCHVLKSPSKNLQSLTSMFSTGMETTIHTASKKRKCYVLKSPSNIRIGRVYSLFIRNPKAFVKGELLSRKNRDIR